MNKRFKTIYFAIIGLVSFPVSAEEVNNKEFIEELNTSNVEFENNDERDLITSRFAIEF